MAFFRAPACCRTKAWVVEALPRAALRALFAAHRAISGHLSARLAVVTWPTGCTRAPAASLELLKDAREATGAPRGALVVALVAKGHRPQLLKATHPWNSKWLSSWLWA